MKPSRPFKRWVIYLVGGGFLALITVFSQMQADVATQVQGQSVRGLGNFMLRTEVDGFILNVHGHEGQECDPGCLVFSLNAGEIESELAGIKAELEGTQLQLDSRMQAQKVQQDEIDAMVLLVERGLEPAKELRRAQMEMSQIRSAMAELQAKTLTLQAQKEKAELRLSKYRIQSPMAGTLTRLHKFNAGDVVKAGDLLAEISPRDGELSFEAKVSPTDISMVKVGHDARVTLTAFNRYEVKPIQARVSYVSSSSLLDSEGKSYFLTRVSPLPGELEGLGKDRPLELGMTADISIHSGTRSVLAFLLSPLIRGGSHVFTER